VDKKMIVKVKFNDGKAYKYQCENKNVKIGYLVKVTGSRSEEIGEIVEICDDSIYYQSRYFNGGFEIESVGQIVEERNILVRNSL
jgi:hypothetical protein